MAQEDSQTDPRQPAREPDRARADRETDRQETDRQTDSQPDRTDGPPAAQTAGLAGCCSLMGRKEGEGRRSDRSVGPLRGPRASCK